MKKVLLIFGIFIIITNSLLSDIPQKVSFQGMLKDNLGNVLSGTYNITVKLYDTESGGTSLWTETQSNISVSNGLLNLTLGANNALNLAFDRQYWVEIAVGSSEPLPRIKLNSVPYSLYSKKTSNIIQGDSLVFKDTLGVTRMVINPNTGTFKMMNHDTVFYSIDVNSPPVTYASVPPNGIVVSDGNTTSYYNSNGVIEYSSEKIYLSNGQSKTIQKHYNVGNPGEVIKKKEVTSELASNNIINTYSDEYCYKNGVETSRTNIVTSTENSLQGAKTTETLNHYIDGVKVKEDKSIIDGFYFENTSSKTYDQSGNLVQEWSENLDKLLGILTVSKKYYKDGQNEEEVIKYYKNHSNNVQTEKFLYVNGVLSKKITENRDNSKVEERYDSTGNLVSKTITNADGSTTVLAPPDFTTGFSSKTGSSGISFGPYFGTPGAQTLEIGRTSSGSGLVVGYNTGTTTGSSIELWSSTLTLNPTTGGTAYIEGNALTRGNSQVNGNSTTNGNQQVNGNLNVNGTKNFLIDHPDDPLNKYLVHASIESNEVLNQYSGNVVTDANGYATVKLPDYFDKINIDYRYQLTVIGEFAQAIISKEINNNQFEIRTDKPNIKVSWQITARRNDEVLKAKPFKDVLNKEEENRGKLLFTK